MSIQNINQLKEIYDAAKKWTLEAGELVFASAGEALQIEYKTSAADLVTAKDKEIENYFIARIKNSYHGHFILGEEGQSQDECEFEKETVWIIDPIDGTTNFIHQKEHFAISVALYDKGKPVFGIVYDPIKREMFHAFAGDGAYLNEELLKKTTETTLEEAVISVNPCWLVPNEKINFTLFHPIVQSARAVRYLGSAALEIAYVACGRLDAYIDFRLSPWDIAAAVIILNEVEVPSTTIGNKVVNIFENSTNLIARPNLHQQLFSYICKK